MSLSRIGVFAAGIGLLLAGTSRADFANNYALFGGQSVTFQGYAWVSGGPVGSNGDVAGYGPAGIELDDLYVGGSLNLNPPVTTPSHITAHGNVIVNGTATLGTFSEVFGSLNAGGLIQPGSSSTFHGAVVGGGGLTAGNYNTFSQIRVGGNINFGTGNSVSGTTSSNGNIIAGLSNTFTGVVTNPGTFTFGTFSTNPGGRVVQSVTAQPVSASRVDLPPSSNFASGGASITLNTFNDVALAPGSYGPLVMAGSSTLRLTGGTYRFDSINSTGTFQTLKLDLTNGPIHIFVSGDVKFQRVEQYVNGVRIALDFNHVIDPSLAENVFMESHGNVDLLGDFFGTIYTPTGNIKTGTIGSITGSLIAGNDLTVGSSNDVASKFVPSAYLRSIVVPEPTTLGLFGGVVAFGIFRRKKRKSVWSDHD